MAWYDPSPLTKSDRLVDVARTIKAIAKPYFSISVQEDEQGLYSSSHRQQLKSGPSSGALAGGAAILSILLFANSPESYKAAANSIYFKYYIAYFSLACVPSHMRMVVSDLHKRQMIPHHTPMPADSGGDIDGGSTAWLNDLDKNAANWLLQDSDTQPGTFDIDKMVAPLSCRHGNLLYDNKHIYGNKLYFLIHNCIY